MPTVAETLVIALAEPGVTQVWGVVGDALNPVTDAIRREDGTKRTDRRAAVCVVPSRSQPVAAGEIVQTPRSSCQSGDQRHDMDDDVHGIDAARSGAEARRQAAVAMASEPRGGASDRVRQPIVSDAQTAADQRRLAAWGTDGGRWRPAESLMASDRPGRRRA